MDTIQSEVVTYWQRLVSTLHQRGLLKQRTAQGGFTLPTADAILLPDRCVYVLDMQRLAGIAREQWLDAKLWDQWRAALQGRRVIVSDGGGLAVQVAREPGTHTRRLPAMIPLDLGDLPERPYAVALGQSKRGLVTWDIAGGNRAILIGGTSGKGKTNLMQAILLQLATKHTPSEVQLAVIDTKEVDFNATFARLPHLFAPIAHTLEEAGRLIEAIEGERLRRQSVMAAAGVADWRDMPDGEALALLVLVVDEAADFAKTPAMDTLVELARKGRAMGVSLIVGTQSPSSKVIDPQVRANLPTALAFQCRSHTESQVILGRKGAEALRRPGLALTYIDDWRQVQTLRVDLEALGCDVATQPAQVLTDLQLDLVRYAIEEQGGAFTINGIAPTFQGDISRRQLVKLAQRWEARGWLTTPEHATDPRRVTGELLTLAGICPPQDPPDGHTVTGVTGGHRGGETVTGSVSRGSLSPTLAVTG